MILGTLAGVLLAQGASAPYRPEFVPPAPKFSVTDLANTRFGSEQLKGRTTVLFVFCACRECRLVAEEWVRRPMPTRLVQTLVTYSGDAKEVRRMAKRWPEPKSSARFLVDPKYRIAESLRALPCPAAFVVDGQGRLRYSSKEVAGELETDPKLIVDQVLDSVADVKSGRVVRLAPKTTDRSSPLVAAPFGRDEKIGDRTLSHTIAARSSDREVLVERVFQFRNPSKKEVAIDRVISSCGCQEAGLLNGGSLTQSATIAPGKSARVRVRLKIPAHFVGQKTVQVWLMAKGASDPLGSIQIELRGES